MKHREGGEEEQRQGMAKDGQMQREDWVPPWRWACFSEEKKGLPQWGQQSKAQRQIKARMCQGDQQVRAKPRTPGNVAQKCGCF